MGNPNAYQPYDRGRTVVIAFSGRLPEAQARERHESATGRTRQVSTTAYAVTDTRERAMRPTIRRWPLSNVTSPAGALIESPAMVRAHVGAVLTMWQMRGLREVAELVVSELVTNVVVAATEPDGKTPRYFDGVLPVYQVGLFSDRAELRIEVFDTVPGMPTLRDASPDDEHGRGLMLVEAMTGGRWGSFPCRNGKVVFAHVQNTQEEL